MHNLALGQFLTRRDVAVLFGGNTRTYLPQTEHRVVAGCFDPKMNPSAPFKVLVGSGRTARLAAERLLDQKTAIPIFLKRAPAKWEFVGHFKAVRLTFDREEVEQMIYDILPRIYESYRKRYGDVYGVLFFE